MSCLHCKKSITGRHLALGCSVCCRWQHRKCNMGIDIMVYRAMVQGMGEDICSDIPWLPKIETVYSEAIVQEDDYLNVKSNIDDSPLFSTPWLPIITSVYSEAEDHVYNGIKSEADFDSTYQIPCFPKVESVCSGHTTYENNLPSVDLDPAYRTDLPIENCPKCYTNLTPVQFIVNVVTAVMKTSCQCGLSNEIIPKLSTFKGATIKRKRKRSESTIALKRLRLA